MSEAITSLHNPRVQQAVRLRERRGRRQQRRIVIDGAREVARAIEGGVALIDVYVCEARCQGAAARRTLVALPGTAERWNVSEAVFDKLAFGQRSEGIVAVAHLPRRSLNELQLPENPLVAVLEGIEKPGNVGAVIRTADAAGVSAVVVVDGGTDLYNPNAIRASLGTIFTMSVCAASAEAALAWLGERRLAIFAARVDGAVDYTAADFTRPAAVVLGSEAAGLSDSWRAASITAVRLPLLGQADSLNVSATAAVLFYESLRQRRGGGEISD